MPYCPRGTGPRMDGKVEGGWEYQEDYVVSEIQKHLNINYIMYYLNRKDMQKL